MIWGVIRILISVEILFQIREECVCECIRIINAKWTIFILQKSIFLCYLF